MLDDKPNFSEVSILAFPLTTVPEFNVFVVGGVDADDDKLAPSVIGFAAEKPNEMPEIRTFENGATDGSYLKDHFYCSFALKSQSTGTRERKK